MDRPRTGRSSFSFRRLALSLVAVGVISGGLLVDRFWLSPWSHFERKGLTTAIVKRGALTLSVEGVGRLSPVAERWITSRTSGTVKRVFVQPGDRVEPDGAVVALVNPQLRKIAEQAELELAKTRADHQALLANIADRRLNAQARLIDFKAAYDEIQLRLDAETNLRQKQTISEVAYRSTQIRTEQALAHLGIEELRMGELESVLTAEESASEARLAAEELEVRLAVEDVQSLIVKAESEGVAQSVLVEPGQQVMIGEQIARVANTEVMIGTVRVPESFARHVSYGQSAVVTVLNTEIPATVSRVDPAVTEGSVAVDLRFGGPLPPGARPELSIRTSIIFAKLDDVLHVRRPQHVKANGTAEVYRMDEDMRSAVLAAVRFGPGTHGKIQVVDGVQEGDVLILTNRPAWEGEETLYFR